MDFKKLQSKIIKNAIDYSRKYNVKIDQNFALLKLYEEVGELAQSVLIHQKKCRPEKYIAKNISKNIVAKELADIVGVVVVNAHLFGIDLEKAIREKWINKKSDNIK